MTTTMTAARRSVTPSPSGSAIDRASSGGALRSFSKNQGGQPHVLRQLRTSVGYVDAGLPDEFYLTIGFLDHPERFEPRAHAYWRLKLPWVEFADDLPRIDTYSRDRDPAFGNPNDR